MGLGYLDYDEEPAAETALRKERQKHARTKRALHLCVATVGLVILALLLLECPT